MRRLADMQAAEGAHRPTRDHNMHLVCTFYHTQFFIIALDRRPTGLF